LHPEKVPRLNAEVNSLQFSEAAQQQTRSNQKDKSHSNLGHEKHAA
jgi:hypothetical protein